MSNQILNIAQQKKLQISCSYEIMPNGESRTKMKFFDGSEYILTSRAECADGAWQNSHYHKSISETFVVQKGLVASAHFINKALSLEFYHVGEVFTFRTNEPHNIYLFGGAIIHTVKQGESRGRDWHASPELDALTKDLSEQDIFTKIRSH